MISSTNEKMNVWLNYKKKKKKNISINYSTVENVYTNYDKIICNFFIHLSLEFEIETHDGILLHIYDFYFTLKNC